MRPLSKSNQFMPNSTDDFPHALPDGWQIKLSRRANQDGGHGSAVWLMPRAPFNRPALMPTLNFRLRQAWPDDAQIEKILEWYSTKSPFSIRCQTVADGVAVFVMLADNMDEETFLKARLATIELGRAS
jgi:hypothetical protein